MPPGAFLVSGGARKGGFRGENRGGGKSGTTGALAADRICTASGRAGVKSAAQGAGRFEATSSGRRPQRSGPRANPQLAEGREQLKTHALAACRGALKRRGLLANNVPEEAVTL